MSNLLYHYTNSKGLLGIISTNTIWATDVEFLNDSLEVDYSREVVSKQLDERANQLAPDGTSPHSPEGSRADVIRTIVSALNDKDRRYRSHRAYVACFCTNGDLLSQWRAYGAHGGYAIGFLAEDLEIEVKGPDKLLRLKKISYGLDESLDKIEKMIEGVARNPTAHPGVQGDHQTRTTVLPTLATIKHPSFREEQEWRLLATGYGDTTTSFRVDSLGVVPYVELQFPSSIIRTVVVGPGHYSDVRSNGIKQLLQRYKMHDQVEMSSSVSPIRF